MDEQKAASSTFAAGRARGLPARGFAAWALVAVCGLACVMGTPSAALAQFGRAVNPDQSVTAEDALIRVRELGEAGNTGEALRVLQQLLEVEGDKMVLAKLGPGLYEPVRESCHRLLREWPELLARYRVTEAENANRLLAEGAHARVERSRFMTEQGFEASLRVALERYNAGDFEGARLALVRLESHPDAAGPKAIDAAKQALAVARQLDRARVQAWADAYAARAELLPEAIKLPMKRVPDASRSMGVGVLMQQVSLDPLGVPTRPLNSVSPSDDALAEAFAELDSAEDESRARGNGARGNGAGQGLNDLDAGDMLEESLDTSSSPMLPASANGLVVVSDGFAVACLDAATLTVRWRIAPTSVGSVAFEPDQEAWGMPMMGRTTDPTASVSIGGGVVVVATGDATEDLRTATRTVHGIDLSSGRVLWSISPSAIDANLRGFDIAGPILIDGGLAIVSLNRSGIMRRESELYIAGLGLFTGATAWVRRVGSVGVQPWIRQEARPESALVHEGVVYRGDDMGVLGAFEASTGRPRWVRQLSTARIEDLQFRMPNAGVRGYELATPIAVDDVVLYLDSVGNRIIRVEASTGQIVSTRDASAFGDPRYMVRLGEWLCVVGQAQVAFVKLAEFDTGRIRLSPRYDTPGITGRCIAAGDRLLVPIQGGLAVLDPANPTKESLERETKGANSAAGSNADTLAQRNNKAGGNRDTSSNFIRLVRPGNPLVVALPGNTSTLVVAERQLISSYLRWDRAQELLAARAAADANNPVPLLTMIELGSRAGRSQDVPGLAERVLTLVDKDPLSLESTNARTKLFDLLATMTRRAIRAWHSGGELGSVGSRTSETKTGTNRTPLTAPSGTKQGNTPGTLAPELFARILSSLGRSAETPAQQVEHALALAWLHEIDRKPGEAIEAYQSILSDSALSRVEIISEERSDVPRITAPVTSIAQAGPEASRRILSLLGRVGIGAYVAFDDEAARVIESVSNTPEALEAFAERYPGSKSALDALSRAVELRDATRASSGFAAAVRGLELSRAQANAARDDAWESTSIFVARVLESLEPTRPEAALRLARWAQFERPGLVLLANRASIGAPQQPISMAVERLSRTVLAKGEQGVQPIIGASLAQVALPMEGWVLSRAMIREHAQSSNECVAMLSRSTRTISVMSRDLIGNRFVPLWMREYEGAAPVPILITAESTLLYWGNPQKAAGTDSATGLAGTVGANKVIDTNEPNNSGNTGDTEETESTGVMGDGSGSIECIDSSTGLTKWKVPASALSDVLDTSLLRPGAREQMATPMDGQVRGMDVLMAVAGRPSSSLKSLVGNPVGNLVAINTGQTQTASLLSTQLLWVVRRDGRYIAIDANTGLAALRGELGITNVYDVSAGGNSESGFAIAFAGARARSGSLVLQPRIEVLDAITGTRLAIVQSAIAAADPNQPQSLPLGLPDPEDQPTSPTAPIRIRDMPMGDHARFVRVLPNCDVLIGSAGGLARLTPTRTESSSYKISWNADEESARALVGAWISTDDSVLVAIDGVYNATTLNAKTGLRTATQPETTGRLGLPLQVRALTQRAQSSNSNSIVLASPNGLLVIGAEGVVIGADGIIPRGNLAVPAIGHAFAVCVQATPTERPGENATLRRAEVSVLDMPHARIVTRTTIAVPDQVGEVALVDDTVLITAGESTLVVDAPR